MLIHHRYDGLTLPRIFEVITIATRWSTMHMQNATQVHRSDNPQTHTVVPRSRYHVMHNGYQIAVFEMEAGMPVEIYHPDVAALVLAQMGLVGVLVNPGMPLQSPFKEFKGEQDGSSHPVAG